MDKKVILVVDDAPANIDLLSGILKENYKVKAAISGDKALKTAAKIPPPDLILLDVMMPGMDGYETCRQLKVNADTRDIPVVFVTAKVSKEEEQKGMDMGAIGYLTKPVDAEQLMETIQLVLG